MERKKSNNNANYCFFTLLQCTVFVWMHVHCVHWILCFLPSPASAAIGCTKNYQPIGVSVYSHCVERMNLLYNKFIVESFAGLLQWWRRGRGCSNELWFYRKSWKLITTFARLSLPFYFIIVSSKITLAPQGIFFSFLKFCLHTCRLPCSFSIFTITCD